MIIVVVCADCGLGYEKGHFPAGCPRCGSTRAFSEDSLFDDYCQRPSPHRQGKVSREPTA